MEFKLGTTNTTTSHRFRLGDREIITMQSAAAHTSTHTVHRLSGPHSAINATFRQIKGQENKQQNIQPKRGRERAQNDKRMKK